MNQSMAQALAPHGVFFHVITSGFIETDDMVSSLLAAPRRRVSASELPRAVAAPEQVARTVAFLASDSVQLVQDLREAVGV